MSAPLNPVEVRLLGCLIEKRLSTPEYYPLTANSLLAACNQKSNRDPVLELDPARVEQGLTALRARQLVTAQTGSGQRSEKYLERFCERSGLLPREQALLAELLLRGPQTPGELRTRCTRMVEPGSLEDVQEVLEALLALDPPLVHQLERQPGKGERRWCHLLAGAPEEGHGGESTPPAAVPEVYTAPWQEELQALREEVAGLKAEQARLAEEFARFRTQFE